MVQGGRLDMRQNGWKQRQCDSKHKEHTHSIQPYLEERREQGTHGCVNCSLDKHEVLLVSFVLLYEILS